MPRQGSGTLFMLSGSLASCIRRISSILPNSDVLWCSPAVKGFSPVKASKAITPKLHRSVLGLMVAPASCCGDM
jgi:isocitrate lyase